MGGLSFRLSLCLFQNKLFYEICEKKVSFLRTFAQKAKFSFFSKVWVNCMGKHSKKPKLTLFQTILLTGDLSPSIDNTFSLVHLNDQ